MRYGVTREWEGWDEKWKGGRMGEMIEGRDGMKWCRGWGWRGDGGVRGGNWIVHSPLFITY